MKKLLAAAASIALLALLGACSDTKSYAELLIEEDHAVNRFLADQIVVDHIPADSVFLTGADAPYYMLDPEGNIYMQVLDPGDSQRPASDNRVYFRFTRYNLSAYETGKELAGVGNADDLLGENKLGSLFFVYNNYSLKTSAKYGVALQMPMRFVGSDAKVNLVVKSQYGWTDETGNVIPYLYTVRYYESPMFPWTGTPAN